MADLNQLLAQILGLREEERPNLNPHAGAPGLFGRRVVPGRPALGYGDVAPMPPQWAERGPQTISAPQQQMNPFPFPMGGPQPQQVPVAPMPQAARVGISDQNSPGAFGNFADYANTTMGLQTPQSAPQPQEQWRMALDVPATDRYLPLQQGEAAPRRGMEPPSAPITREAAPFSIEDAAWAAAKERAHEYVSLRDRPGALMGRVTARLDRRSRPILANNRDRR